MVSHTGCAQGSNGPRLQFIEAGIGSTPPTSWRAMLNGVSIDYVLLITSVLLLLGILASKVSARLSVPALALFLVVGMLAGSDGPGGIPYDDPLSVSSTEDR